VFKVIVDILNALTNLFGISCLGGSMGSTQVDFNYRILSSIVRTFFIENDAEILHTRYTWKVAFINLIHKQSIQV
jgi:hypothetical protein